MKYRAIALFLIFTFILTSGFGCKKDDQKIQESLKPITLKYWRVFDDSDAFDEIIAKYQQIHPFITIEYKKLRPEEYEDELINALAEDRGPDIFAIQNTWLKDYQNKLEPMPESTTLAYPVVEGGLSKKVTTELRTTKSLSLKQIKNLFVDTVYQDIVLTKDGKQEVYGLPLSVDTLAMYYNKSLLNNAGIVEPPTYWNKTFQQAVKKLTKQNTKGKIIQSGVAMGEAVNIERSADILSLLMMQNGAIMMEGDSVLFHRIPGGIDHHPAVGALDFYSDFSNPGKEVYNWNNTMDNSLEMFIQGNLAMMFGYSYHLPIIKSRAPKLNFGTAKMPQIENNQTINFANYWLEVVSSKSAYTEEAWDFIQFLTKAEQAKIYLDKTKKPTALRSLVDEQRDDLEIGIFADQVLTAQSWYNGSDTAKMEDIMNEMINIASQRTVKTEDIINQGASKIQQTIK